MSRVLVVEDELLQRTAFVKALSKLEDCRVTGAASVGAALEAIDAERPEVIISDIGLPDRLGVELLGELARRGLECPIVFVTADVRTYRHLVPLEVMLLEKPVPLAALRALVAARLAEVRRLAQREPSRLAG